MTLTPTEFLTEWITALENDTGIVSDFSSDVIHYTKDSAGHYYAQIFEDLYHSDEYWDSRINHDVRLACAVGVGGCILHDQDRNFRFHNTETEIRTAIQSHLNLDQDRIPCRIVDHVEHMNDKRARSFPFIARWLRIVLYIPKTEETPNA